MLPDGPLVFSNLDSEINLGLSISKFLVGGRIAVIGHKTGTFGFMECQVGPLHGEY